MHCWSCIEFLRDLFPMGAGASTSSEEQQPESLKSRLGRDFDLLTNAYTRLSKTDEFSDSAPVHRLQLERCFNMKASRILMENGSDLQSLVENVGSALAEMIFKPEGEQVTWTRFVDGYENFCGSSPPVDKLNTLLRFFNELRRKTKPVKSSKGESEGEGFAPGDFKNLLWICWLMMYYHKLGDDIELPSVEFLVKGAFSSDEELVPTQALHSWMITSIPNVSDALVTYILSCLQQLCEGTSKSLSSTQLSGHLSPGRLWSLGLSQRGSIGELLLSSVVLDDQIKPLYRSPIHGKGMNRFWSQVEGYRDTVLFIISGMSSELSKRWVIAVVVPGGLENKGNFYGSNGACLISVDPKLSVFRATGKEKNFVYTHKNVPGGGYNARKLPDGIGFGGSLGSERFWMDDDFSMITLRHHSVDKTYQPGALLSHQGYAPIREQVLEVELWGLGGNTAAERMATYQDREKLFAEQRRKVDLKAFGDWQDSPEKMMMDMVSDPNRPRREQR